MAPPGHGETGAGEQARFRPPRQRLAVWFAAIGVTFFVAVTLYTLTFHRPWYLYLTAVGGLSSTFSATGTLLARTDVTSTQLRVQALGFRTRTVPGSEVLDVRQPTAWSPVRVYLTSGEDLPLPGVEKADIAEVRRILHLDDVSP